MADSFEPVYEVTHTVDGEISADFDVWLGQHVEEMLGIQGLFRAEIYVADDHEDGRPRRVSLYHFESDTDLENYLAGPADVMRQSADKLFGGRFETSRRVLREKEVVDGSLRPIETCPNCDTSLAGQYCGNCGQRAQSRLISLWQLLREAFGDLLELDSRLWRTLVPLIVRPGKLTGDYLEGRRARFMPPFRTYLVLSILFFLVAFFDPREQFSIFFEADTPAATTDEAASAAEIRDEVLGQLVEEGIIAEGENSTRLPAPNNPTEVLGSETTDVPVADEGETSNEDDAFNIQIGNGKTTTTNNCDEIESEDWPAWLPSWITPARMETVCERAVADNGKAFLGKLLDNVPAALIALLPLMALILKMLYPLSRRYYVEHVLFVVHFHAFFFLNLTLQILFSRLTSLLRLPDAISTITSVTVSLYILVYLFKAMRRVYAQGWLATFAKYLVLLVAYFVGLTLMILFSAVFAVFSI
jgi:uncharacterized protein DUF3667/uncharacterized protein DUF4286